MKKLFVILIAFVLCFAGCSAEEEFVPERGSVENYIYENPSFGIKFEADDEWYYLTDEEIANEIGTAQDELFTEEFLENMVDTGVIYDMYCVNLATGATVSGTFENAGIFYGEDFDENTYLEMSQVQINEQLGEIKIWRNEIGTVEVSGKEVPCIFVEIESSGAKVYEIMVVKKVESWVSIFTFASISEEDLFESLERLTF